MDTLLRADIAYGAEGSNDDLGRDQRWRRGQAQRGMALIVTAWRIEYVSGARSCVSIEQEDSDSVRQESTW